MSRRDQVLLWLLGGLLAGAVVAEGLAPGPLDWTPSLDAEDTRPYGGRIVRELLPVPASGAPVETVTVPPYLRLRADTTRAAQTYLFVTPAFEPDPAEAAALLAFAGRGGTLFIAAERLSAALADSLGLRLSSGLGLARSPLGAADSVGLRLVNPALGRPGGYRVPGVLARIRLTRFDTLRTTVLGLREGDGVNFIRTAIGAGQVFVHTAPLLFTNYAVLSEAAADYAFRALAYLPPQPVWWDAYHKPTNTTAGSPLRFILADPALRAAWQVLLVGVLLYVGFAGKRRQRVVPVIPPRRNTSLGFARTVGRLYLHHGRHAALAEKKITYFLEDLRTRLNLPSVRLEADAVPAVAARSGVPEADVAALFDRLRAARAAPALTADELLALSDALEAFHAKRRR